MNNFQSTDRGMKIEDSGMLLCFDWKIFIGNSLTVDKALHPKRVLKKGFKSEGTRTYPHYGKRIAHGQRFTHSKVSQYMDQRTLRLHICVSGDL